MKSQEFCIPRNSFGVVLMQFLYHCREGRELFLNGFAIPSAQTMGQNQIWDDLG